MINEWFRAALQAMMGGTYTAHGFCLLWDPDLMVATIAGDLGIAGAYLALPVELLMLRRSGRLRLPGWVTALFASFILLCGAGHLLDVLTLFRPVYWASAALHLVTAAVSLLTAAMLPLALRSPERSPADWLDGLEDEDRLRVLRRLLDEERRGSRR